MSSSLHCFSLFRCTHTALGQGLTKARVHIHPTLHAHVSCASFECCFRSLRHLHSLLLPSHLSYHPAVPTARHLQLPRCWWTNTLRTSAEGLGTLAENVPPTGCEAHFAGLCTRHHDDCRRSIEQAMAHDDELKDRLDAIDARKG